MRIFICEELVNNLESSINRIKKIQMNVDANNYEAYFIYAFALFESAFCGAIRHILGAFPEKINREKYLSLSSEDICNNLFAPQVIFETLIENEIRKVSKGSALKIVVEAERIFAIKLSYDTKHLEDISIIRNQITHENTPSRQDNRIIESKHLEKREIIEKCKKDIIYLSDILLEFSIKIKGKYSKYTKYKMLKEFWDTLFDSPLLRCEDCIFLREEVASNSNKKVVGFNFDHIKRVSNSISSSEKFFLSILFQQYSQNINERFFRFSDIPMLVSISDKKKIYLFLHVMVLYPYLFNGMNMREDNKDDEIKWQSIFE
ncbi:hypothetical protein [Sedimentibacter sp.]|uniref:hypothetical protein n=1 Tax=Sedimentibacter sp. TaxID=1960295 RepID=UPI0028AAB22E|nr:hypothetical protein [Sedimentibacter sp.]